MSAPELNVANAALNVASLVARQASLRPASPAIISHDQIITYGQLKVAVGIVARYLRQHGVTPGQVVGVSMGQNALHVITLLALAQVGAVSLPLHIAVPADRRALAAKRFGVKSIVSGLAEMALSGLPFLPLAGLSFDGLSTTPDSEIYPVDVDTPFRVAITSGTSGDPKGIVLSHGLIVSRTIKLAADFTSQSRSLPMDLSFNVGLRPMLTALVKGGVVVFPRSLTSDHLLQAIVSHGVTHVLLSPNQARGLVDCYALHGTHFPGLARMTIAGGSVSRELLDEIRGKLTPNVEVLYASTESGELSLANREALSQHPNSVGKVNNWVKIQVVDESDLPLPALKVGQLRIRSEHQVTGYYLDEERTRKHFRDGWFYPGDLGGFDENGLLYIEGRADDQLNSGGLKINPEDIDATLAAHPAVAESGAFILNQAEGGEALAVAVVLRSSGKLEDIQNYAYTKLGPLAPARYFAVPSLPRTITGKLRRGELTAQYSRPAEE